MNWEQIWSTVQLWLVNVGIKIVIALIVLVVAFNLINLISKKLAAKLEKPVRDTVKRTIKLSSPIYASAMGLMDLIIDTIESRNVPASGFSGGIKDFFRSLLGG